MKNASLNIKIDPKVKKEAQKLAEELGLTLTDLINGSLKAMIRRQEVHFSLKEEALVPSEYLKRALAESEREIKAGYVSPAFENIEDEIAWLKDPNAKDMHGRPILDKI